MLTSGEIYYLNSALESKEIHGLSYTNVKAKLFKEGKKLQDMKEGLIEKGYLDKDGNLNMDSYQVIRNLEIYKKTSKYITINKIFGALGDDGFIPFFKEEDDDLYAFKKTTKELLWYAIIKEYDFIKEYKETEGKEREISLEEITRILTVKSLDESIYVRKTFKDEVEIYNVYYYENNIAYKYNVQKSTLREINPKDIRKELEEILEMR